MQNTLLILKKLSCPNLFSLLSPHLWPLATTYLPSLTKILLFFLEFYIHEKVQSFVSNFFLLHNVFEISSMLLHALILHLF